MLAGFPVLAQVGAFPPAEPAQEERLPFAEPEPAPATAAPPAAGAPAAPASPFGLSPDNFPGLFGGPPAPTAVPPASAGSAPAGSAPAVPESPFGLSPDIFPGLLGGRPDRRVPEQPATPGAPGVSATAPAAGRPVTPIEPEPEAAVAPQPAQPAFLTPPYGYGNITPGLFLPPDQALPVIPANPPPTTGLAPLAPGAIPVQAYDLRAPPILIRPTVSVFGGYTDNPNDTPKGFSDVYARLYGSTAISVDTVRLQGQLVGGLNYQKYARATNQDTFDVNLLAYGLGTVVQEHIFIDGRAAITQTSQTGGLVFAAPTLIRNSNRTQVITTSVSPIARQSIGGYVDGELRYNHSAVVSQNGNNSTTTTSVNLSNATSDEATLTLASGRLFTLFGSRLTLDATKIDSQSASRSTQLRAFDDLSYPFNQKFAGLARLGYENLDYPLQPSANFRGASWEIGGQYTPFPGSYFIGTYGRRDGLLGFSGALRYEITSRTTAFASFTRNRASQQQQILNNLNASSVDANGNPINQFTGLPVALGTTGFNFSNAVFKYETARAGLQTQLDRNSFGLFAFLSRQSPFSGPVVTVITTGTTGTDTTGGVNLSWLRSLTPRLSSTAAVGFSRLTTSSQNTLTTNLSMSYLLGEKLTAVLNYQFINVDSSAVGSSYRRNQVEIGLTRSF